MRYLTISSTWPIFQAFFIKVVVLGDLAAGA